MVIQFMYVKKYKNKEDTPVISDKVIIRRGIKKIIIEHVIYLIKNKTHQETIKK